MSERDELREYLDTRFQRVEDRLDRARARQDTILVAAFVMILGIFGGGFTLLDARIEKVNVKTEKIQKAVDKLESTIIFDDGTIL